LMPESDKSQGGPARPSAERKRSKEEVILLMLCGLSIPSILPFGLYRLFQRNWLSAAVDLALVLGMVLVMTHVWRTGRYKLASLCVTIFYSAGMLATIYMRGLSLVYWVYPTMIAAYFVLRPSVALAINSFSLLVLVLILQTKVDLLNLFTVVVTISLVNLFSTIFSHRTGLQNRELHTATELDFLTGVGNRRALDRTLAAYAAERRPQPASSLLLLDLDHFKRINDTYGHAAGDQVLVRLCELMRRHTRSSDLIFRYGGEEFAIVASGAGLEAGGHLAGGLRAAVAAAPLLEHHPITISIGVADMDKASTPADWLKRADEMLYAAKQDGRDRVRVAPAVGMG
jgi:diguanylate cyclase